MSLTDRIESTVLIEEEEYPLRVNYIFKALEACKQNNVQVGSRLDHIVTLYNNAYGKDHFSHTSCPVTDEAEIFALILDHAGIDTAKLMEQAPLLAAHYQNYKQSGLNVDTKPLYEFLKPELETHLARYSISAKRQT